MLLNLPRFESAATCPEMIASPIMIQMKPNHQRLKGWGLNPNKVLIPQYKNIPAMINPQIEKPLL